MSTLSSISGSVLFTAVTDDRGKEVTKPVYDPISNHTVEQPTAVNNAK